MLAAFTLNDNGGFSGGFPAGTTPPAKATAGEPANGFDFVRWFAAGLDAKTDPGIEVESGNGDGSQRARSVAPKPGLAAASMQWMTSEPPATLQFDAVSLGQAIEEALDPEPEPKTISRSADDMDDETDEDTESRTSPPAPSLSWTTVPVLPPAAPALPLGLSFSSLPIAPAPDGALGAPGGPSRRESADPSHIDAAESQSQSASGTTTEIRVPFLTAVRHNRFHFETSQAGMGAIGASFLAEARPPLPPMFGPRRAANATPDEGAAVDPPRDGASRAVAANTAAVETGDDLPAPVGGPISLRLLPLPGQAATAPNFGPGDPQPSPSTERETPAESDDTTSVSSAATGASARKGLTPVTGDLAKTKLDARPADTRASGQVAAGRVAAGPSSELQPRNQERPSGLDQEDPPEKGPTVEPSASALLASRRIVLKEGVSAPPRGRDGNRTDGASRIPAEVHTSTHESSPRPSPAETSGVRHNVPSQLEMQVAFGLRLDPEQPSDAPAANRTDDSAPPVIAGRQAVQGFRTQGNGGEGVPVPGPLTQGKEEIGPPANTDAAIASARPAPASPGHQPRPVESGGEILGQANHGQTNQRGAGPAQPGSSRAAANQPVSQVARKGFKDSMRLPDEAGANQESGRGSSTLEQNPGAQRAAQTPAEPANAIEVDSSPRVDTPVEDPVAREEPPPPDRSVDSTRDNHVGQRPNPSDPTSGHRHGEAPVVHDDSGNRLGHGLMPAPRPGTSAAAPAGNDHRLDAPDSTPRSEQILREPPSDSDPRSGTVRRVDVTIDGTGQPRVRIDVREQAARLEMVVRTSDAGLNERLRAGLDQLVGPEAAAIREAGYRAEPWIPDRISTPHADEPPRPQLQRPVPQAATPGQGDPSSHGHNQDRRRRPFGAPPQRARNAVASEQFGAVAQGLGQ
ncbi:MAG: hypothetical protein R2729_15765 [Bryobacteraceae bacterium]